MLKIAGYIPISIYPFFWFLAVAIGWLNTSTVQGTFIWMFIILFSVLIHEFGHALTALAFGQKAQIELVGFGGVTKREGKELKPWQEFVIVLNGPLAGFALCGACWWAQQVLIQSQPNSLPVYIFTVSFYVNMFWTILNLMPVLPLDGGKLLSIVLEYFFGVRGPKIAFFISLLISSVLGIFFFIDRAFLAGSLFFLLAFESYKSWKTSLLITTQDQDSSLQQLYKEAEEDCRVGHKEEALQKFLQIRAATQFGVLYLMATEYAALLFAENKELDKAYELLNPNSTKISLKGLRLLHHIIFKREEWQKAIEIGDRIFRIQPNMETAIINASCYAALGKVKPALGWLQSVINEGRSNIRDILSRKEFDAIRSEPLFQSFIATLPA